MGAITSPMRVSVLVGDGFDLWLHSYFLTGLMDLAREGSIVLRPMNGAAARKYTSVQKPHYPLLVVLCKAENESSARVVCFDARDQSDVWHHDGLACSDVYFKRSYHPPSAEELVPSLRSRVVPLNPIFATWSRRSRVWSARLCGFLLATAAKQLVSGEAARKVMGSLAAQVSKLQSLSSVEHYEDTPAGAKCAKVLFQTRLWDPDTESGDWVDACNRERVEMVRTLRSGLGDAMVGGLASTPYAARQFPELLSNLTEGARSRRPEFIRLCKTFLVRVNIKALFQAVPYSLGETLAANNCIVSQAIRNTFATPFAEGRHYLGFTTPRECVDQCMALLGSGGRARRVREEAHAYYRDAVRPKEAMRMYLQRVMSLPRHEESERHTGEKRSQPYPRL